jgi:hypothetical protein
MRRFNSIDWFKRFDCPISMMSVWLAVFFPFVVSRWVMVCIAPS